MTALSKQEKQNYLDLLLAAKATGVPTKASGRSTREGRGAGKGNSGTLGLQVQTSLIVTTGHQINHMTAADVAGSKMHLFCGEVSGVLSLPTQTSPILVRTLLIKAALVSTFSVVDCLATVDKGRGLETADTYKNMLYSKFG